MGEDDTDETKMGIYDGYIIRVHELAFFLHRLQGLLTCSMYSDLVPLTPSGSSHVIPHVNTSKPNMSQHNARNLCGAILCATLQCAALPPNNNNGAVVSHTFTYMNHT